MNLIKVEKQIGQLTLSFETGIWAKQAAGSVVARYGDTVILNASTTGASRPGTDFFPLTCDYRERTSAAGKFPGGFIKREGRPTLKETLTSRLIDRPIRPLFPDGFRDEVQVQAIVLSSDRQFDPDVIAMNGAAACLMISPLPFQGPVASVRLGRVDDAWVVFPTFEQLESSELDLIISGNRESVLMIEGFARELPEELMFQAIAEAHRYVQQICDLQEELVRLVQPVKAQVALADNSALVHAIKDRCLHGLKEAKRTPGKQDRAEAVSRIKEQAQREIIPDPSAAGAPTPEAFSEAWHAVVEAAVRELILEGHRPDGRGTTELRDIQCFVSVLPRTHGSAIFQRGETQALVSVTLGTSRDEQRVDGLQDEYAKKFMLDYNFPPFSVGECRPIRGPGRREMGHGALAERSVKPVLPDPDEFPYTVRVVSDILESNGSSSMATVCGAVLGLMDAGVPITNPVAGISVGLVQQSTDRWTLLTDIIGDEDHYGDMDFKIAGTQNGITGIQLDLKIRGIGHDVIRATLAQSREARMEILRSMLTTIPRPKDEISAWAPRLLSTNIHPDKIGLLIGPGGKTIRAIQESTGAVIEVDDSGRVTIACSDAESAQAALDQVEALTASVQIGKIYNGRVTSVKDFGVFVEILPGRDGLCHISELSDEYVRNVSDVCRVGDTMRVIVIDIDDHDRVKLSRRRVEAPAAEAAPKA